MAFHDYLKPGEIRYCDCGFNLVEPNNILPCYECAIRDYSIKDKDGNRTYNINYCSEEKSKQLLTEAGKNKK
jgi:hypothetical protein